MKSLDEILKDAAGAKSLTTTPTSLSADPLNLTEQNADEANADAIPVGPPERQPTVYSTRGAREAARPASKPVLEDTCPLCGGAGFVLLDVPVGDPDFGRAMPCRCRQQTRLERRIRMLQGMSSLATLSHLNFENFIQEPSHLPQDKAFNLHRAFDTCLYFAQNPDGWLLLTGGYGCGKTHLGAAIASYCLNEGQPAVFMVVPDLLDHLRATYSPQSDMSYDNFFEQLRTTPLLILDDLGTQSSTAWAQEKLFQLLNHRYNARLATVITTNQRIDDMDPRLRSRLLDPSLVTHFPILAPDFRAGKNAPHSELSTLQHYRDKTFENFEPNRRDLMATERETLRSTYDICQRFAEHPEGWLVLMGYNGTGKTHLAAAIANRAVALGQSDVMFIVVPDLLDHLRAAFSPNSNIPYDRRFDEVRNAPFLVLDDVGIQSATPWAKEKLFQLLNYRYSALLPTVLTTTTSLEEMEPWLKTRILDTSRCRTCRMRHKEYISARSQSEDELFESPPPRTRGRRTK